MAFTMAIDHLYGLDVVPEVLVLDVRGATRQNFSMTGIQVMIAATGNMNAAYEVLFWICYDLLDDF